MLLAVWVGIQEEADLTPRDAACEAGGDEAAVTVEEEGKAKG